MTTYKEGIKEGKDEGDGQSAIVRRGRQAERRTRVAGKIECKVLCSARILAQMQRPSK